MSQIQLALLSDLRIRFGRSGLYAKQIETYNKLITIQPNAWLHFNGRATAHLLQDDDELAMQDYLQATSLASPDNRAQAAAMENIGLIHLRRQNWLIAFQHSENVNRLDDEQAWNWLIRGIAAAKLKRNIDAYVAFDNWFKFKRGTDPYLLKQYLPEDIHPYIDVSAKGLAKLVDPPKISGERCDNPYQCKSFIL